MALQGTIKDFGLAEIFQLIGMQRKTGVLSLENEQDTVTVYFRNGQVIGADTKLRNLEDLLGSVLVRTGLITDDQLQQTLKIQKKTLQRLGYILVNEHFISEADLSDALRIQVSQIVYRLFRWRNGQFRFSPMEKMDYEQDMIEPIGAENLLMEGARMIDEWPIIERRIRSDKIVFHKTEAGAALEVPMRSIVDESVELDFGFDGSSAVAPAVRPAPEIKLSEDEREILLKVDGRSTVRDICESVALGEFDTYRLLYELLTRNLIAEVKTAKTETATRRRLNPATTSGLVAVGMIVLAVFAIATLRTNPLTPWRTSAHTATTGELHSAASRIRLEQLEKAIQVFYLDTGSIPPDLQTLALHGYLTADDLLDPWGRPYEYQVAEGGYLLAGLDPDGRVGTGLLLQRKLSSAERMMVEGISDP